MLEWILPQRRKGFTQSCLFYLAQRRKDAEKNKTLRLCDFARKNELGILFIKPLHLCGKMTPTKKGAMNIFITPFFIYCRNLEPYSCPRLRNCFNLSFQTSRLSLWIAMFLRTSRTIEFSFFAFFVFVKN